MPAIIIEGVRASFHDGRQAADGVRGENLQTRFLELGEIEAIAWCSPVACRLPSWGVFTARAQTSVDLAKIDGGESICTTPRLLHNVELSCLDSAVDMVELFLTLSPCIRARHLRSIFVVRCDEDDR